MAGPTDSSDQSPAIGAPAAGAPAAGSPDTGFWAPARLKRYLRALVGSTGMLLIVVVVLGAIITVVDSAFLTIPNLRNIGINASTLLVLAVGFTFVLVSGGLDLSLGSVLVFSGVVSAKVMASMADESLFVVLVGLVAALAAGAAWGLLHAILITRFEIAPLIVTLGSLVGAQGAAALVSGGSDITKIPEPLVDNIGFGRLWGIPYLLIIVGFVTLVSGIVLAFTRFGRYCYAIGSNQEAALRAGVPVKRHLIKVYVLCATFSGLAGYLSLAQFSSTTIAGHSQDVFQAITGVVLGGASIFGGSGTIVGTAIGVAIPAVLLNGLVIAGVQSFWQQVAVGIVLVTAVYVDGVRRRSE